MVTRQDIQQLGKVWVASCPFTDNIKNIRSAIDAGVDAVVLKSVTDLERPINRSKKQRTIIKNKYPYFPNNDFGRGEYIAAPAPDFEEGDIKTSQPLYCWSDAKDIEILTLQEANKLFDEVKEYSPETKVIQSFAPRTTQQFNNIYKLKADAFEINSRWYKNPEFKFSKPISFLYGSEDENTQTYLDFQEDKINRFNQFFKEINREKISVPIIYKLSRDQLELPLEKQLAFQADGFTFSDSQKVAITTTKNGVTGMYWGKGSQCGSPLYAMTKQMTKILRKQRPDTYLSASGGILTGEDAAAVMQAGADSIQLCTAIYQRGFNTITEAKKAIAQHEK